MIPYPNGAKLYFSPVRRSVRLFAGAAHDSSTAEEFRFHPCRDTESAAEEGRIGRSAATLSLSETANHRCSLQRHINSGIRILILKRAINVRQDSVLRKEPDGLIPPTINPLLDKMGGCLRQRQPSADCMGGCARGLKSQFSADPGKEQATDTLPCASIAMARTCCLRDCCADAATAQRVKREYRARRTGLSISSLAAPGNDCPYSVERAPIWCFSGGAPRCLLDHDGTRAGEFVPPLLSVGRPLGCDPTLGSQTGPLPVAVPRCKSSRVRA